MKSFCGAWVWCLSFAILLLSPPSEAQSTANPFGAIKKSPVEISVEVADSMLGSVERRKIESGFLARLLREGGGHALIALEWDLSLLERRPGESVQSVLQRVKLHSRERNDEFLASMSGVEIRVLDVLDTIPTVIGDIESRAALVRVLRSGLVKYVEDGNKLLVPSAAQSLFMLDSPLWDPSAVERRDGENDERFLQCLKSSSQKLNSKFIASMAEAGFRNIEAHETAPTVIADFESRFALIGVLRSPLVKYVEDGRKVFVPSKAESFPDGARFGAQRGCVGMTLTI